MTRIFCFLLGFIAMTIGFFYIILYFNLISFGYHFKEYLSYLVTRYECFYLPLGFLIVVITTYRREKRK